VNLLVLRQRYSGGPELWHFPLGKRLDLSSPQLPLGRPSLGSSAPTSPRSPPGAAPGRSAFFVPF